MFRKYKFITLPKGGKLAYTKNTISKTTSVEIVFDCGARYDTIPGLAHFTEHMFFTGTKTLTKEQVSKKYFDFMNVNAFTNSRNIAFTGNVFTNEFADYLSTVATLINESTFSQSNIDKEIPVVQQEIARSADNFKRKANEFYMYCLSNGDVYKNRVLGNEESVASIKSKHVKNYVKKFFVANNCWIYVSSPMNFSKVKKLVIDNLENKLNVNETLPQIPLFYGSVKNPTFYEIKYEDINKAYLFLGFNFNRKYEDVNFKYKFGVVTDMINDYSEGVLKHLRLNKSLTYSANFDATYDDKSSIVQFRTECDKKNINEIIETLAQYLKDLLKNGFTEEQLKKAKRDYDYSIAYQEPRTGRLMDKLYNFKFYGKILNQKAIRKLIKNITIEECNEMFKEVFAKPIVNIAIYGNVKEKDVLSKQEFEQTFNF